MNSSSDTPTLSIACFMNMPSPHQEGFYRVLTKHCRLKVFYTSGLTPERRRQGWSSVQSGYDNEVILPGPFTKLYELMSYDFNFVPGCPSGLSNLMRGLFVGRSRIAFQAEMPEPAVVNRAGWRKSAEIFVTLLSLRRIACLGIGSAMRQLATKLGLPQKLVFPFAYFTEVAPQNDARFDGPIVFAGQLIQRKGVDMLLRAYARSTKARHHRLLIVGDGVERSRLETLSHELDISRVQFVGTQDRSTALAMMSNSSCCVLPSRHDGWGTVVNEAIQLGVPVIASRACGSAELIESFVCGSTFQTEDVEELSECFDRMFVSQQQWKVNVERAKRLAPRINPEAGSAYFLEIVKHIRTDFTSKRPTAPWLGIAGEEH